MIEELKQEGNNVVEATLSEQVTELKSELDAKKQTEKAHQSKVSQLENEHKAKLEEEKKKAEAAKSQVRDLSKERDQVQSALTRANKHV